MSGIRSRHGLRLVEELGGIERRGAGVIIKSNVTSERNTGFGLVIGI
jgi:hypothetical protein